MCPGRSFQTTIPSNHQDSQGLVGTVNRDLLYPCPAPPVRRPRNPIRDVEVQSKGRLKSRESKWRVATDLAVLARAFNIGVHLLASLSGGLLPPPGRRRKAQVGFSNLRPVSLRTFETVLVAPQARQLVASAKRFTWVRPVSAAFPLQYKNAGVATVSSGLPAFRSGLSSTAPLPSGFPDG